MSVTCYLILLNRTRIDSEVLPMISNILAGQTDTGIQTLRGSGQSVASSLDVPPETYFQSLIRLAIDTLEGRLTQAFVDELTPPIVDPAKAWKHNVDTLVRGGLVLSLCTERPAPQLAPVFSFKFRPSKLICEYSPTASEISNHDVPELVELARVGIFQPPEVFVRKNAVERIANELEPLLEDLAALSDTEETAHFVQHFGELVASSLKDPDLAILRGYL
jgi:hypothetical protein